MKEAIDKVLGKSPVKASQKRPPKLAPKPKKLDSVEEEEGEPSSQKVPNEKPDEDRKGSRKVPNNVVPSKTNRSDNGSIAISRFRRRLQKLRSAIN